MIVHSPDPVTLVGGAPFGRSDLNTALALAPTLVAADGGADGLLALGHRPEAVIGDMDSLSPAARKVLGDRLIPVEEQETTDFDKALRHIEAPVTLALGFSGGRFDHELAALSTLLRRPDRRCIVIGPESITFLCPSEIALDLPVGMVLSLFPMGPVRVASRGLFWPTDHIDFAPEGRIGTSNRVAGRVWLRADRPRMLVILPREGLAPAVAALAASPVWAP